MFVKRWKLIAKGVQTVGMYVSNYMEVLRIKTHPILRHFFNLLFLTYLVL